MEGYYFNIILAATCSNANFIYQEMNLIDKGKDVLYILAFVFL